MEKRKFQSPKGKFGATALRDTSIQMNGLVHSCLFGTLFKSIFIIIKNCHILYLISAINLAFISLLLLLIIATAFAVKFQELYDDSKNQSKVKAYGLPKVNVTRAKNAFDYNVKFRIVAK